MRYSYLLASALTLSVSGGDLVELLRNRPKTSINKPKVEHADCRTSVDRLKTGPVDIDAVMGNANTANGLKYYDVSFYGHEMLYWEE